MRILIAEDDQVLADGLLRTLLAAGAAVDHVASGTEALLISLMALGIKPGDEVITTPFTFVATAEVIVLLGAKPVFVDVEPDTCNIDESKIEEKITSKTKVVCWNAISIKYAFSTRTLWSWSINYNFINLFGNNYRWIIIYNRHYTVTDLLKVKKPSRIFVLFKLLSVSIKSYEDFG